MAIAVGVLRRSMLAGQSRTLSTVCRLPRLPLGRPARLAPRAMSAAAATGGGGSGLLAGSTFWLDSFALRQWDDPNFAGTRITHDKADFVARVEAFHAEGRPLVDGYAPFCKHLFVPNFIGATVGALAITDANRHLLRSGYTQRRLEELGVLTRWFPADQVQPHPAKFLDIILYSREQLLKEYEAMPQKAGAGAELPDVPWGIISIKAQDEDCETPMQPITMMRNALGREEGGSGVAIDRAKYAAAVAYWEAHAAIQ